MKVLVHSVNIMGAIDAMCSAANVLSTLDVPEFQIMEVNDDNTYTVRADKITDKESSVKKIVTYSDSGAVCVTPDVPETIDVTPETEKQFTPPNFELAA